MSGIDYFRKNNHYFLKNEIVEILKKKKKLLKFLIINFLEFKIG